MPDPSANTFDEQLRLFIGNEQEQAINPTPDTATRKPREKAPFSKEDYWFVIDAINLTTERTSPFSFTVSDVREQVGKHKMVEHSVVDKLYYLASFNISYTTMTALGFTGLLLRTGYGHYLYDPTGFFTHKGAKYSVYLSDEAYEMALGTGHVDLTDKRLETHPRPPSGRSKHNKDHVHIFRASEVPKYQPVGRPTPTNPQHKEPEPKRIPETVKDDSDAIGTIYEQVLNTKEDDTMVLRRDNGAIVIVKVIFDSADPPVIG